MKREERYATVRFSFLNGGTGEAIRNVTSEEFEMLFRKFGFGETPNRGVGSVGNGFYGFNWKIYDYEPDYVPSIFSRLCSFKMRKQLRASGLI